MKLPRRFFQPLATGAPAPFRDLPVKLERMIAAAQEQLARTAAAPRGKGGAVAAAQEQPWSLRLPALQKQARRRRWLPGEAGTAAAAAWGPALVPNWRMLNSKP